MTKQHSAIQPIQHTIGSVLLKKNLLCLQKYCPSLYKKFATYCPKEAKYCIDNQNQGNIIQDSELLISDHTAIQSHIQAFIKTPICVRFLLGDRSWKQSLYVHDFHLERIRQSYHATDVNIRTQYPEIIPCMLFLGIGLGDQIIAINSAFQIHHIFIYEPSNDLFFASLQHIDYEPLLKKFTQNNKSIHFHIGTPPNESCRDIVNVIRNDLSYAGTEFFIFERHMNTYAQDFSNAFMNTFHQSYNFLGFLEDELIGLKHVIKKLEKKSQYINKSNNTSHIPVFIIGSGPSLDQELEFIQQHQHCALIFSASSSLNICYQHGIKPDFHVEIERNKIVVDRAKRFPDKAFLKDIHLLGASTLHPDIIGIFGHERFALKSIDLATNIINKCTHERLDTIYETHPTSGNGAITFALFLGFRRLFLFGLDLSMPSETQHHSKHALYFEANKTWELKSIPIDLVVPGNYTQQVNTTHLLDTARVNIESLLATHEDAQCFNISNGAAIQGATAIRSHEIKHHTPLQPIDKKTYTHRLIEEQTQHVDYQEYAYTMKQYWIRLYLAIERTMSDFLQGIHCNISTKEDLFHMFYTQQRQAKINFYHTPSLFPLLNGTFTQLQNTTSALLLRIQEGPEFTKVAQTMMTIWQDLLSDSLILCRTFLDNKTLEFDYDSIIQKYPEFAQQT